MSVMSQDWTKRGRQLLPLLIGMAAILPFLNGIHADFTFDDVFVIRDNPLVHDDRPLELVESTYLGGLYRPLTMLTYAANARLGNSPFGYHVVNVALHSLISILVFVLGRILMGSTWIAAVAALLFAVHPIHTEAVTSIVGRAELLAALSVLSTLLTFIRAERSVGFRRNAWMAVSVACFAAGSLAKEGAFTALPLVAVVHVWLFRGIRPARRAAVLVPYAAAAIVVLIVRFCAIGSLTSAFPPPGVDNPLFYTPALPRIGTAIVILWEYASQLAVPWHLSADYSFNQIRIVTSPWDPRLLGAAFLLSTGIVALLWRARRSPEILVAFLFLAVPLALTANLLFPIGTIRAERLLYLPSFGWCLLCAWLAARAVRFRPQLTVAALAVVITLYAGRTWARNLDWQDNVTLFEATVRTSPASVKAHYNLACFYYHKGRMDDAMFHFRKALSIYPEYATAALGVGRIYELRGLVYGALHYYERALHLNWELPEAHLDVGNVRLRLGEIVTAEAAFRTGLEFDPDNAELLWNLSVTRRLQGDLWEADALAERVEPTDFRDAPPELYDPNVYQSQYAKRD